MEPVHGGRDDVDLERHGAGGLVAAMEPVHGGRDDQVPGILAAAV